MAAKAKAALIDDQVLFAGSINWTHGGFEHVYETNLEIHGGPAPGQALERFWRDWSQSDPARPPGFATRAIAFLKRLVWPA